MVTHKVRLMFVIACVLVLAVGSVDQVSGRGNPVTNWFLISPLDTPEAQEWYSSVAYNSQWEEYLVVWHASTATNHYIYGQFVSKNGAFFGSRFLISPPVGHSLYPDVAYNPARNEYLVVYMVQTTTAGVYGIYGWRINAYGVQQGFEWCFATNPPDYSYWHPAVAYSIYSGEYLVTWQKNSGTAFKGIQARTLPGDGGTMSATTLEITGLLANVAPSLPDVAYSLASNEFLVVWQKWYDSSYSDHDIMGQRIGLTGGAHLESFTFPIHNTDKDEGGPAIASISPLYGLGEYLVTCEYQYAPSAYYIVGRLLTDVGTLDNWMIISPSTGVWSAVAGNQNTQEFLVAWDAGTNIQARTVSTSGALGSDAQALPYRLYPDAPAVASGPMGDYLVTCNDQYPGYNSDVFGFLWGNRVFLPTVIKN